MHDEKYLKGAACAKHFAVHSGPEDMRNYLNSRIMRWKEEPIVI